MEHIPSHPVLIQTSRRLKPHSMRPLQGYRTVVRFSEFLLRTKGSRKLRVQSRESQSFFILVDNF